MKLTSIEAQARNHTPRHQPAREARKSNTKRRIFDHACALIAETDFVSTTIDKIAAAADIGRATFYLHYRSKTDIVEEACAIIQRRLAHICRDFALGKQDHDSIIRWIETVIAMHEDERPLLRIMLQYHGVYPDQGFSGESWHTLIIDSLSSAIEVFRIVREGHPQHRMVIARAHMLLFALERFIVCSVLEGGVTDRDAGIALLAIDFDAFINRPLPHNGALTS